MADLNTPILFLVFNRPEKTRNVFDAIRKARPAQLYVSADGHRLNVPGEKEKCDLVRAIVQEVDWDCELKVLFRDENLGCGKAVSGAISWFFEQVEEGIILEDDCLPDQSFFRYCEVLLNRYKYDERIMHIGGNNFQFGKKRDSGDYYYSILSHIWGWASWRRAWQHYEFDLKTARIPTEDSYKIAFNKNNIFIDYYQSNFLQVRNQQIDTWDYQWLYAIIRMNGLAICPEVNLVQNIGFGEGATHTMQETIWNKINIAKALHSFEPPSFSTIAYEADAFFLTNIVGVKEIRYNNQTPKNIFSLVKKKARLILKRLVNKKQQLK